MKIIHTSDVHLDSPLTSRLSPEKSRERKRELILSFRRITEDAVRIGASAVIIAGDLFDSESASQRTVDTVLGFIEAARDVAFLYLPGNHEKDRVISIARRIPDNLMIFGEDWTYFKLGEVTVAGRSRTEKNMFSTLTLNPSGFNIAVLHGEISDSSDSEGKIGLKEVGSTDIDYLALGHYHSYSERKAGNRCSLVYSGTPEGRGFDETGRKGYVIIDTEGKPEYRFVSRSGRTLHILPVDVGGTESELEIEGRVGAALSVIPPCDMVRVVLGGEHEPYLRRDTDTLLARFEKNHYYLEIKDESRLRISSEDYKNDKSLKGEFIRLVLSREDLSEEDKAKIIECGIRALAGEEYI